MAAYCTCNVNVAPYDPERVIRNGRAMHGACARAQLARPQADCVCGFHVGARSPERVDHHGRRMHLSCFRGEFDPSQQPFQDSLDFTG